MTLDDLLRSLFAPQPKGPVGRIYDPFTPADNARMGIVKDGNIDFVNRPWIPNPEADSSPGARDGHSTTRSMSTRIDGREVLLPMTDDGANRDARYAIDKFFRTGRHLGQFATPAAADAYANTLHNYQVGLKHDPQSQALLDMLFTRGK